MIYEIKDAGKLGKGAYALRNIKKDEIIAEFSGEVVDCAEIHQRILSGLENVDDPL